MRAKARLARQRNLMLLERHSDILARAACIMKTLQLADEIVNRREAFAVINLLTEALGEQRVNARA